MASTITPNTFTVAQPIAPQALLIGNRVRGQLDLRGVFGAMLQAAIARISTTAYTTAPILRITRILPTIGGSAGAFYSTVGGASTYDLGRTAALTGSGSVTRVVSTANSLGDVQIITKTSDVGSTVNGSVLAFLEATGTAPGSLANAASVPNFELAVMDGSSGSGPWTKTLSAPLGIVHSINDYITDAADCWDIRLDGGFVYNIVFDAYATAPAGATGCVVMANAAIYPSDNAS